MLREREDLTAQTCKQLGRLDADSLSTRAGDASVRFRPSKLSGWREIPFCLRNILQHHIRIGRDSEVTQVIGVIRPVPDRSSETPMSSAIRRRLVLSLRQRGIKSIKGGRHAPPGDHTKRFVVPALLFRRGLASAGCRPPRRRPGLECREKMPQWFVRRYLSRAATGSRTGR
jgi:hypothetical protein